MAQLNVGDVIEFPKHAESTLLEATGASITLSQGVPGRFRVESIDPATGNIKLEILTKGVPPRR